MNRDGEEPNQPGERDEGGHPSGGGGGEGAGGREESLSDYVDSYVANWRDFRGPLWEKLALTARNRTRAHTVGRGCCGHPGEPGC